jgi:hypothetical protein
VKAKTPVRSPVWSMQFSELLTSLPLAGFEEIRDSKGTNPCPFRSALDDGAAAQIAATAVRGADP